MSEDLKTAKAIEDGEVEMVANALTSGANPNGTDECGRPFDLYRV